MVDFLKKYAPGLLVLLVSFIVYGFTVAPTTSFWDCGEFIASARYLQVPHPPGAPLYLLIGRMFSLFAFSPESTGLLVNFLSVVASSFAVFFVYKVLLLLFNMLRDSRKVIAEAGSVGGALLFAFTDTFWYSAVEAEVYALSLFFAVITLWAFLRWYTDDEISPRWFYLGVYLLGLSIGVHLLNLLLIPVFAVLFGWKLFDATVRNTLLAVAAGLLVLGFVFWGIVSSGLWPAMKLELFLVNTLGMFRNSGLLLWVSLIVALLLLGVFLTRKRSSFVHLTFVSLFLIIMGMASYALVPLRAADNTPVNMNAPDNVFSLHDYVNRSQYGSRPLIYGVHAGASPVEWETKSAIHFNKTEGRYEKSPGSTLFHYNRGDYVFFPRIYSSQKQHLNGYEWWTGINATEEKPRFIHQVEFFLKYQIGHHYLRYLMWNFVGRQNDTQGHGDMLSGNYATGIDFVDRHFLGSRQYLSPQEKYSPAANHYYGLPLLLAFAGLLFLLRNGAGRKKVLGLIGLLILMTGPAIALYLNQPPYEPRERDYIFVASFMGMALFGGIGIYALINKVVEFSGSVFTGILSGFLLFMAGPGLLFSVNLNDHDRSDRYLARDLAVSQLRSCPPRSILFTYGDNDTYPLWYAQQVEGIRQDIRIVNIGLLGTTWYMEQLMIAEPGNSGLKFTLSPEFYRKHSDAFFGISSVPSAPVSGGEALERLKRRIEEEADKTQEVLSGSVGRVWEIPLPDETKANWNLTGQYFTKGDLGLADIIASNAPERPVCFTRNADVTSLKGLGAILKSNGLVRRLDENHSESDLLKEVALFTDSIFVGSTGTAYWDNTCRSALNFSGYREVSLELSRQLLEQGYSQKAGTVLSKSIKEWPYSPYVNQVQMLEMIRLLLDSGLEGKASDLLRSVAYVNMDEVFFYFYSDFDTEAIQREYCGLFREIRSLAKELKANDVLLETEIQLDALCSF